MNGPHPSANPWGVFGWMVSVSACFLAGAGGVLWGFSKGPEAATALVHGGWALAMFVLTALPLVMARRSLMSSGQTLAFAVLGLMFTQMLLAIAWTGVVVLWLCRAPWGVAGVVVVFFSVLFAQCVWATRALRCWPEAAEVAP